ncbi:hypothetical protein N431DRAFT_361686 [Stipitochalara longipes BDJ]|nr:hypothetical protein N431DRAFT_361686 [Stipitochalara longipes BDJ]
MPPISLLRLAVRQSLHVRPFPSSIRATRPFSHSPLSRFPRKDSQDRNSINTEATEYSKSGTDDGAAKQEEAAFDPDITDPAKEEERAGEGKGKGNPLDVSPANPEVSQQGGGEAEGGAENAGEGKSQSGGGSPKKSGKP